MPTVFWSLSARLQDGLPIVTPFEMRFQTTSGLLTDIQAYAAAYLPLLDAITQSQILLATINIPFTLPGGLKAAPVALSQNQDAALLDYTDASGPFKNGFSLPNFIPAGYLSTVPTVVDKNNPNFSAFNTQLLTGSNTTRAVNEDDVLLTAFRSGEVGTRKHRRQVSRAKLAP